MNVELLTPAGERLLRKEDVTPWQDHPRPQMRRENWLNLNGMWEFAVSEKEVLSAWSRSASSTRLVA